MFGRLRELQAVQRCRLPHEVAFAILVTARPQLGLPPSEIGFEHRREGLVHALERFGTVAGGVFAELDAGVEVRGDGARLRRRDGRNGADRDARLPRSAPIPEEPRRAMRP